MFCSCQWKLVNELGVYITDVNFKLVSLGTLRTLTRSPHHLILLIPLDQVQKDLNASLGEHVRDSAEVIPLLFTDN